jgi:hypothetical protein
MSIEMLLVIVLYTFVGFVIGLEVGISEGIRRIKNAYKVLESSKRLKRGT